MENKITWAELIVLEPRLVELEKRIKSVKKEERGNKFFCANWTWYNYFKGDVCSLVGWEIWRGANPKLATSEAYDVAYHHLYELFPPCRDCTCI